MSTILLAAARYAVLGLERAQRRVVLPHKQTATAGWSQLCGSVLGAKGGGKQKRR